MSTASMSTVLGTRTFKFKITGYSLRRGRGVGKSVRSPAFDVGGYLWRVYYYPDGKTEIMNNGDYASVFVGLVNRHAEARVSLEVRLLDQTNKLPPSVVLTHKTPLVLKHGLAFGEDFLQPSAAYLRDDILVVECDITVFATGPTTFDIQVPPSDLSENLGELLDAREETDVTFEVQGEVFPAHKLVLALRSRVFKAELFGPMSDRTRRTITIEDMQPAVFSALLHFIYKDSLPSMEHLDGDDGKEMVKHMLVAADRYALERMKVMCESILCKSLDVENVTDILALADQHYCSNLKDACLEFIISPDRMDDVMASQGYAHLKRSCPYVVIDMFERANKSRRM